MLHPQVMNHTPKVAKIGKYQVTLVMMIQAKIAAAAQVVNQKPHLR
jgi:hypothetical protein